MEIKTLQNYVKRSGSEMKKPFSTAPEIMMTIVDGHWVHKMGTVKLSRIGPDILNTKNFIPRKGVIKDTQGNSWYLFGRKMRPDEIV